jgi:hypothetical protein
LSAAPLRSLDLLLDTSIEDRFKLHVIQLPLRELPSDGGDAGANWFRLRHVQSMPEGHRLIWVLRSSGTTVGKFDIVAASPFPPKTPVFLVNDLLRHIDSVIRLAKETWTEHSYLGEGKIAAILDLSAWESHSRTIGRDPAAFTHRLGYRFPDVHVRACKAFADTRLSFSDLRTRTDATVRLAVPLLREAGISVNAKDLTAALQRDLTHP